MEIFICLRALDRTPKYSALDTDVNSCGRYFWSGMHIRLCVTYNSCFCVHFTSLLMILDYNTYSFIISGVTNYG